MRCQEGGCQKGRGFLTQFQCQQTPSLLTPFDSLPLNIEGVISMQKVLEVKNLKKSYKNNKAVDGLSFDVYEGEILGVLGPNGAGKSTTINILSTILKKDEGEILYFGKPIDKQTKASLGIVPQDLAIYEDVSAYRNIKFFASLYGLKKQELEEAVTEALKFVGLEERKMDKPRTYSGRNEKKAKYRM